MSGAQPIVLVRGGGDLATGVAARLHRCGFAVIVLEIAKPLAVRRLVALAQAVFVGEVKVEELVGRRVEDVVAARKAMEKGVIPVMVDPQATLRFEFEPLALVDGRMLKRPPEFGVDAAPMVIGLGPGFEAGVDCHAVVETHRGHHMGRVLWEGAAQADTAIPEPVAGYDADRVLRAPAPGAIRARLELGTVVRRGEVVATFGDVPLRVPFDGVLRGLLHDGVEVEAGVKVGDLDPRGDPSFCHEISDKALAVGGGVLEALFSRPAIRRRLAG